MTDQYVYFSAVRECADPGHANGIYVLGFNNIVVGSQRQLLLLDRCQLQCHGDPEFQRLGHRALRLLRVWDRDGLSPDYSTSYSASSYNNTVLFAGMWFDPTTGLGRTSTRWDNTVLDTFMTSDPRRRARTGSNTAETTRPTKPTPLGWSRTRPGPRRTTPAMMVRWASRRSSSQVMTRGTTHSRFPTIRPGWHLPATAAPARICMPTTAAQ